MGADHPVDTPTAPVRAREVSAVKPLLVSAVTAALLVGSALPAAAHATVSPTSAAADTEVTLSFRSVVERSVLVNKRFEVIVPTTFETLDCSGPVGWSCEIDEETYAPFTHVSWDAAGLGGTPADIQFDLTVRTPAQDDAGTYLLRSIQTHGDEWVEPWIYEEEPYIAPRLQVGDDATVVNGAGTDGEPACFGPAEQPASYDEHDGERHNDDCAPGDNRSGSGSEAPVGSPTTRPATGPGGSDEPAGAPSAEPEPTEGLPATGGGAALLGATLVGAAGVLRKLR